MGVLLYKLVFTTLTHSIAEDCFTPLSPSDPLNRKRNCIIYTTYQFFWSRHKAYDLHFSYYSEIENYTKD
jgi:hypothetical protein